MRLPLPNNEAHLSTDLIDLRLLLPDRVLELPHAALGRRYLRLELGQPLTVATDLLTALLRLAREVAAAFIADLTLQLGLL